MNGKARSIAKTFESLILQPRSGEHVDLGLTTVGH
jgi:hypothetical protein